MMFTGVLILAFVASATAYPTGIADSPQTLMKMAMTHCKRGFIPLHGTNCPVNTPRGTPSPCPLQEPWKNAFMPQNSQSPYTIQFIPPTLTTYTPGTNITVELVAPATHKFKGFFIHVDGTNFYNGEHQLHASVNAKMTTFCSTKGLTHTGSTLKEKVTFTFTPDINVDQGSVQIVATVVKDFRTFYDNIKSKPLTIRNPLNKPTPFKYMQSQFNQGGLAEMMKKVMQNFGAGGAGGQPGGGRPGGFQMPRMPQQQQQQQPMGFGMSGMPGMFQG
nr:CfSMP1 reeler domain-containing protein [Crepidula fornicata]